MHTLKDISYRKLFIAGILVVLVVGFVGAVQFVFANGVTNGWGWGGTEDIDGAGGAYDGMGWVSFGDTGINIPVGDGPISGYAWSGHYGWISFDALDLGGCPSGNCIAERVGTDIKGWARIISICDTGNAGNNHLKDGHCDANDDGYNAGGWSGWIQLDAAGNDSVRIVAGAQGDGLAGYAWSDELGWIQVDGIGITAGQCLATTVDNCVLQDGSGVQNGQCAVNYVGACRYACQNGGWKLQSNTCTNATIDSFEVCDQAGNNCAQSTTTAPGTSLELTWGSTNTTQCELDGVVVGVAGTQSITANALADMIDTHVLVCQDANGSDSIPAVTTVDTSSQPQTPTLTPSDRIVTVGTDVTISWDTKNGDETQCTLTGPGLPAGNLPAGGNPETGTTGNITIKGSSTFTLTCGGVTVKTTVDILPTLYEN